MLLKKFFVLLLSAVCMGEDVKTVVGLEYTAYTVREGSMADDPALGLWVCVALQSGRLVERFTGTLTALPNTALVGDDFEGQSHIIAFGNNLTSPQFPLQANETGFSIRECVSLPILNDDIPEADEVFEVVLERTSGPESGVHILPSVAAVTITDDDDLHLTISQSLVLLAEDSSDDNIAGQFDLCVSTAQSLQRNATVSVSTEDRTAQGGVDYVPIDEELTIGAEASATHTLAGDRVCVTVQAIADNIRETTEVFRIIIDPLGPRVRLLDGIVSVFIEDRDLDDIGQENSCIAMGYMECCAVSTSTSCVVGDCCCDQACFTRTLCPCCADILNTNCMPDIPEVGAFQILQSEIVIPEADISAMHVCVELVNGSLWRSVTLTIAAVPGSASYFSDFVSSNVTLHFSATSARPLLPLDSTSTQCAEIFIIVSDDVIEYDEDFYLQLFVEDQIEQLFVSFPSTSTRVRIEDDDVAVLMFDRTELSVVEGDAGSESAVELCVVLDNAFNGLERNIRVNLTTVPHTAGAGDYEPLSSEAVLLTPTQRFRVCSDLVIRGDSDLEGDEEFEVVMSVTEQSIHTDGGNIARVTIIDDDFARVSFQEGSYTVSEGGTVDVCVALHTEEGGSVQKNLTVTLTPKHSNTDDTDYLPLANDIIEITFEPQAQGLSVQKSECVRFVALDDSVQEGAEVFSVAVKAVSETVNTEHPNFASVLILDNDGSQIGLQSVAYTVTESTDLDSPLALCAQLTSLSRDILGEVLVIALSTVDGTALEPEDYARFSSELTFSASSQLGAVQCVHTLSVVNDGQVEGDEYFSVHLEIGRQQSGRQEIASVDANRQMAVITILSDLTDTIGGVAPSITHPPQSTSVALNSSVNLTCTAQGAPQVSHHWLKGGVELPGETGPHLVLERVRVEDRGEYSCKAENSLGQQVSELALLTIENIFQYSFRVGQDRFSRIFGEISLRLFPEHPIPTTSNAVILSVHAEVGSELEVEFIVTVLSDGEEDSATLSEGVTLVFASFLEPLEEPVPHIERYDGCTVEHINITSPIDRSTITISWPESDIGSSVSVMCPCGAVTGVLGVFATRHCQGDFIHRAGWEREYDAAPCLENYGRTLELCRVSEMSVVEGAAALVPLTAHSPLGASELAVVMSTLEWLLSQAQESRQTREIAADLLDIVDNLLTVQSGRHSDISQRVELILSSFAGAYELRGNESSQGFTRKAFGLHIQEIFPVKEDSTDTETTHFTDWLFTADLNLAGDFSFNSGKKKIGSSINSVLADVASAIPGEVFEEVASSQTDESLMLSHVIYLGRNLYAVPGLDIEGTSTVASLVLSVHLSPSKALANFSRPVEFIFQKSSEAQDVSADGSSMAYQCVFWDPILINGRGNWSGEGCKLAGETSTAVMCQCDHFSTFSILVTSTHGEDANINIIYGTLLGDVISLLFLSMTLCGHLSSSDKRKDRHGKIVINMSVALIGLYLIYIVGVFEDFLARTTCVVFSSLLHYCMLVYVGWIGLEATYLFMESLRSKERTPKTSSQQRLRNRLFLLSCAVVWVAPVLVVVVSLTASFQSYHARDGLCFPSDGPLYYGLVLPSAVIYAIHTTLTLISFCHVLIRRQTNSETVVPRLALLLSTFLAFIFAIAWLLICLTTNRSGVFSTGLQVAAVCIFTVLVALHGMLFFMQWYAKFCFCPTKLSQERLNRTQQSDNPQCSAHLPEGFGETVGWTFASSQEYRGDGGTQTCADADSLSSTTSTEITGITCR